MTLFKRHISISSFLFNFQPKVKHTTCPPSPLPYNKYTYTHARFT